MRQVSNTVHSLFLLTDRVWRGPMVHGMNATDQQEFRI